MTFSSQKEYCFLSFVAFPIFDKSNSRRDGEDVQSETLCFPFRKQRSFVSQPLAMLHCEELGFILLNSAAHKPLGLSAELPPVRWPQPMWLKGLVLPRAGLCLWPCWIALGSGWPLHSSCPGPSGWKPVPPSVLNCLLLLPVMSHPSPIHPPLPSHVGVIYKLDSALYNFLG